MRAISVVLCLSSVIVRTSRRQQKTDRGKLQMTISRMLPSCSSFSRPQDEREREICLFASQVETTRNHFVADMTEPTLVPLSNAACSKRVDLQVDCKIVRFRLNLGASYSFRLLRDKIRRGTFVSVDFRHHERAGTVKTLQH